MTSKGKVKFYNLKKGFGFIVVDENGSDVYFNRASLPRDREYDPVEGDSVEFEVREARLGPMAHHIMQITPAQKSKANGQEART